MEITILGPGPVGTLIGGLLSLKGHGVTLRGRKNPGKAPSALRVVLPGGWQVAEGLRHAGPEDPVGTPDVILVALGRHHLHAERRPDFKRFVGEGESPIGFLNCDPAELERLAVPLERGKLCVTAMNAVMLQPGDVELSTGKPAIIFERSAALARTFKDLGGFGFQVTAVDDARPHANALFLFQLLDLPVAMCNSTLDLFLSCSEGRDLALAILEEGFETLDRAGMPVAPLPGMDPAELSQRIKRKPGSFDNARSTPERAYNSTLQSYLRARPIEAPHLNRRIVEIASAAGLHLTWNWRILQKASRVSSLGFYRDPGELLRSLS
jgi:ketopantoate reductase